MRACGEGRCQPHEAIKNSRDLVILFTRDYETSSYTRKEFTSFGASKIVRKVGMAPPHPGAFIRDEILDELGLSVSAAAEALGVRRATLMDAPTRRPDDLGHVLGDDQHGENVAQPLCQVEFRRSTRTSTCNAPRSRRPAATSCL